MICVNMLPMCHIVEPGRSAESMRTSRGIEALSTTALAILDSYSELTVMILR